MRSRHKIMLVAACIAQTVPFHPVYAQSAQIINLGQGGPFISANTKIQQFQAVINSDKIDGKTPVTLTITNGAQGHQAFQWLRVFITGGGPLGNPAAPRGQMILSERDFKLSNTARYDCTGQFHRGNNYVLITGAGVPGAGVDWTLNSVKGVAITGTEPRVLQAGGPLKILGSMFSNVSANNTVVFSQKYTQPIKVTASDATESTLKVTTPSNLAAGQTTIQVTANGQQSNPLTVELRGTPEITGVNLQAGPVGTSFTFSAKNISPSAGENSVFMSLSGDIKDAISVPVAGATADSFNVAMPQFEALGSSPYFYPPKQVFVFLKVNGVLAKPTGGWIIYCARAPWQ